MALKRVAIFGVLFVILVAVLIIFLTISRPTDINQILLSGVAEATQHDLAFRITGLVLSINYDEGDVVDSGAVVAVLDTSELVAAADQAYKSSEAIKAQMVQLNVQLETISRNLNKAKQLLTSGAANQSQVDDFSDQKRQLEAQITFADKTYQAQKAAAQLSSIRRSYAEIASPIKGIVLSRQHEPGEIVMPGSPIISVANLDQLYIKVYLPEIFLGKVKLGQDVSIFVDSHPGGPLPGKIEYISDKAEFTPKNVQTKLERIKQVFALKVACSSEGGIIKPGLPCDVEIRFQ